MDVCQRACACQLSRHMLTTSCAVLQAEMDHLRCVQQLLRDMLKDRGMSAAEFAQLSANLAKV